MRAHHISTNLIHSRKRYQGRCPSLISFIGMIPITVGKIAPTHQRKAQLTALFRVGSSPNVRSVTPATIAKLRKIRIWEAVLFNSVSRVAIRSSRAFSASLFA